MSLGKRLFLIIFCNVLFTLGVAGLGYWGVQSLGDAAKEILVEGEALANHLTSDMMHDAIKGDVLSAMFLSNTSDERIGSWESIQDDFKGHADTFAEHLAKNRELPLSANISAALNDVAPALEAYVQIASDIISKAKDNYPAAMEQLPIFMTAFEDFGR